MSVDEPSSLSLDLPSVMDQLNISEDCTPQYAAQEPPPEYDSFDDAYIHWCTTDKARQDISALDQDPAFAAADKELQRTRNVLQEMKKKSEEAFKASHTKRNPLTSFMSLGRSKPKSSAQDTKSTLSHGKSDSTSQLDEVNHPVNKSPHTNKASTSTVETLPVSVESNPAAEEFKRAREAEMEQEIVVEGLEEKVAKFNRKKEELGKVASAGDRAWARLRSMADETLSRTSYFAAAMGSLIEKLDGVENTYDAAKQTTADFTHARLAVQNSHYYFKNALSRCDNVRSTGARIGRSMLGGLNVEMDNVAEYREAVILASKAQICLNEIFRVLDPHESLIPETQMKDYKELKRMGVLQMSKLFNLMYGGSMWTSSVTEDVTALLAQQETAFVHLTSLAVWIQRRVPVCIAEEESALTSRDDVRREIAAFWHANVGHPQPGREQRGTASVHM